MSNIVPLVAGPAIQQDKSSTDMPVAKGPTFDVRSAAIVGGLAVLAAIVIGVVAIELGTRSNTLILGDQDFGSSNADNMAEEIAENGPILWPDIASGTRDIWLQHIGDDPATGWTAFDARPPGTARDCAVQWSAATRDFTDPCDGSVYPETGEGLPTIPVYIDGRSLIIDINGVHGSDDFSGYAG
jgi:hypothetical protein